MQRTKAEGKSTKSTKPIKSSQSSQSSSSTSLMVVGGGGTSEKLKSSRQKYATVLDALNLYEKEEDDLHSAIVKDGQWKKSLPFGDKKVLVALIMSTPILHDIFYPPTQSTAPYNFLSVFGSGSRSSSPSPSSSSRPSPSPSPSPIPTSSLSGNLRETTTPRKSKTKPTKSTQSGKLIKPSLVSRMTWSCGNCSFVNKMSSGECESCRRPNVVPRTSIPPLELSSLTSQMFPPASASLPLIPTASSGASGSGIAR